MHPQALESRNLYVGIDIHKAHKSLATAKPPTSDERLLGIGVDRGARDMTRASACI
jgi:hypothetical protein